MRWLTGARADRVRILLLLVSAAAAYLVAPEQWRWASVCGVLVAGATVAVARRRQGLAGRFTVCLIGGLFTVAAVTLWHPPLRAFGSVIAAVAVIIYPAARLAERRDETDAPRQQVWRFIAGLAIGAVVATAALLAVGFLARNRGSFAIRYGEPVTVTVGEGCLSQGGSYCEGSTWTLDGRDYTGVLHRGSRETGSVLDAYALAGDDRAWTSRTYTAPATGLEVWGLLPQWLILVVLLIMILAALPARLWRRVRRTVEQPTGRP